MAGAIEQVCSLPVSQSLSGFLRVNFPCIFLDGLDLVRCVVRQFFCVHQGKDVPRVLSGEIETFNSEPDPVQGILGRAVDFVIDGLQPSGKFG